MPITHLLDTSVLSQPMKDIPVEHTLNQWARVGDEQLCTSAICIAEIRKGLEAKGSIRLWTRYRDLIEGHYPVLPFDSHSAAIYADLAAELRRGGKPKPDFDLLIAAIAKQHGLILATLNGKDFKGIPGLAVEVWS